MAKKKVEEVVADAPTRDELVALATEVNAVLNLDNPIKFGKKVSDDDLIDAIVTECTGNVYEIDFIEDPNDATIPIYSEVSSEIFALLGIDILPGSPDDNQSTPEPDADEPDAEEDADAPEPASVKKGGKPAKAEKPAKAPKAEKPAKAKKESNKYTRYTATAAVIGSGKALTVAEIADKSDALYVKNGGVTNLVEAKKNVDQVIKATLALGIATLDANGFTYSK